MRTSVKEAILLDLWVSLLISKILSISNSSLLAT